MRGFFLWLGALCLGLLVGCSQDTPASRHFSGATMGTTWSVVLHGERSSNDDNIQKDIDELLISVNRAMSTYIPDSELSLLNNAAASEWVTVSDDLFMVLSHSLEISEATAGAYDVTVGPLVNLWGFGPGHTGEDHAPTDTDIAKAREAVGYHFVELDVARQAVRKTVEGVYIDLSSIAKGYGVDRVARLLEAGGERDYLVEIGGELRAKGVSPRGDAWKIAVERPDTQARSVQRILDITNVGVATSGDYRNYFEEEGVRYAHTIDGATGKPVTHKLASATVLADDAMTADGWATAMMVLGEDRGIKVADERGLATYFIVKTADGFSVVESAAFTARMAAGQPK